MCPFWSSGVKAMIQKSERIIKYGTLSKIRMKRQAVMSRAQALATNLIQFAPIYNSSYGTITIY